MSAGRNSPCPCGSGKKYKQCCGSLAEAAKAAPEPDNSEALLREGWAHQGAGRIQQAVEFYQRVLRTEPNNADALNLMGLLAMQIGQFEGAIRALSQAVAVRPGMAVYHSNLGNAWRGLGKLDDAILCYREALKIDAGYARGHNNLGVCLKELGRMEEAESSFRRAVELDTEFMEAQLNLARVLIDLKRHDDAFSVLAGLLERNDRLGEAHYLLGKLYSSRSATMDKVVDCYERALSLSPDLADAHWSLALHLLMRGDLQRGWEKYAWRLRIDPRRNRPFPAPLWQGERLSGKTLLVWGEQGVGDEILFASCLPDLQAMGTRVLLECEPRLAPLFARSFPWAEVHGRTPSPSPALLQASVDYQLPAGSLPGMFRNTLAEFASRKACLQPDVREVQHWQQWLDSLGPGRKVGISWRSMHRSAARDGFYAELPLWESILKTPGITFVNLQYGECGEELENARRLFNVEIHQAPGVNLKDELDRAAALTLAMDLVIAPNTSVFAMAGATGTPCWLLNLKNDWTMLGTDHIPWFPSVRVFLKTLEVPWEEMLAQVAAELNEWSMSK